MQSVKLFTKLNKKVSVQKVQQNRPKKQPLYMNGKEKRSKDPSLKKITHADGGKKVADTKEKKKQNLPKPEIIMKEIERNMKELKRCYYESIKSSKNSSKKHPNPEQNYRSCRQSFELKHAEQKPKSRQITKQDLITFGKQTKIKIKESEGRKQKKGKKNNTSLKFNKKADEEKKSLFDIYNFYKNSIDSSLSRCHNKKTVTPNNSRSSKKQKNSSTKIHGTSSSMVSIKDDEKMIDDSINPFQLPRPNTVLDVRNELREKVVGKKRKPEIKTQKPQKPLKQGGQFKKKQKFEIQEIKFDRVPEVQSSLFDKNMPIVQQDSKYEVSSCIIQNERPTKQKYDTEEIQSLIGCQIPKISDSDLDDLQLVSIDL